MKPKIVLEFKYMQQTKYPDVNDLLNELLSKTQKILGDKLVGFYLYGSLVWGDFDYGISDIDLLAALKTDIDDKELIDLKKMHVDFANKYKEWDNRIETQYFSTAGLKTFKSKANKMANISPGEPLHIIEAGKQWLTNWYFVQDYGVSLFGPDPKTIIDHISKEEFIQAVKDHALEWREYIKNAEHSRKYQAYAILTLCRALYTLNTGEQASKHKAATWAQKTLPQWAMLIQNALAWRQDWRNEQVNPTATFPQTKRFVEFIINQITQQETKTNPNL